jgi:NAD+ diphosphatase
MPNRIYYTCGTLDRAAIQRDDEAWVEGRRTGDGAFIVPVWRDKSLVVQGDNPEAGFVSGADARALVDMASDLVLLGIDGEASYFAVDISASDLPALSPLIGEADFVDLREPGPLMEASQGAMLAYARGIIHWHRNHRFCGRCGGPTESRQAGHQRSCADPACGREHYPRTDPAVIMLVTRDGDDGAATCLLGRQPTWPARRYSTLAGFVEPGESLEAAVAREVFEETAIRVSDVRYLGSQPWPFPASLMLGFRARAVTHEITANKSEIEDARWFTRTQLLRFEEDGYHLPRRGSIARWMIARWLEEGDDPVFVQPV